MTIQTHVMPCRCPACGKSQEAITGTRRPIVGDVVLCVYCLVFNVLRDDLSLRMMTDGEWLGLPAGHREWLTTVRDASRALPVKREPVS